jgi:hypothetical protein
VTIEAEMEDIQWFTKAQVQQAFHAKPQSGVFLLIDVFLYRKSY